MKHLIRLFLISMLIFNKHTNANKKNIALCTVATGKYACYVSDWIESARKHFLHKHAVKFYIFTDQILPIEGDDIVVVRWPHKRWPFTSMMRFNAYKSIFSQLDEVDYVYACDVDLLFVGQVDDEVIGRTVGVLHPGYYKKNLIATGEINGLIEKNPASAVYSNINSAAKEYFAGGFYGGQKDFFKQLILQCCDTIAQDLQNGIVAAWHDETHLNHYFLKNPPEIKLSPVYCYPEEGRTSCTYRNIKNIVPKIMVLNKNHNLIRNNQQHLDDREFVILIPSYNNLHYFKKNLDSVFRQNYGKYRVIYIDDNSSDGTGEAVTKYIQERGKTSITTVIRNSERKLAMANIYNTIHQYCHDHEIIVMLDGDDALAHDNVLRRLNETYTYEDVWFTYGNCWFNNQKQVCYWSKKIEDAQIELNRFREWDGAATHLRTFYAWLFKKINKDDLMINGEFFKMTYDVAMFMPIWEMASFHHKFIKEVLYAYNDENPINDHKIDRNLQLDLNKYIRTHLPRYHPVTRLEYFDKVLVNSYDINEISAFEIAAILNDLISIVTKIYPPSEADVILHKIIFLQSAEIDRLCLFNIAEDKNYQYLGAYLVEKYIDKFIKLAGLHNMNNLSKYVYYWDELSCNKASDHKIKFAQWLGRSLLNRCKLSNLTSIYQDVNRNSFTGETPLMMAAADGLPDFTAELLSLGANKETRDNNGKKAIDFTVGRAERWFTEVADLLKEDSSPKNSNYGK